MPRVKIPRKSTAIDMTAMCDVAFLLLTFFILTAKPKAEDPVPVDTPGASTSVSIPEKDIATLTVGQGKVFFGVEGPDVRKELLTQMGSKYNVGFTQAQVNKFANMNTIGVPVAQIGQYLDAEPADRERIKQPGVPADTTGTSELYNWVHEARVVTKNLHGTEMRVTIKGDSKEEYPTIKKIIAILQKQEVNKFSFITSLKGESK
ncbi:ExbD/TolR family protein [Mucilaginibacter sp.]